MEALTDAVMDYIRANRGLAAAGAGIVVLALAAGGLFFALSGQRGHGAQSTNPNATPGAASPSASGSADASPSASAGTTPGASTAPGATGSTTGRPGSGGSGGGGGSKAPVTTSTGFTYTPANLFSGAAARQGITATDYTICTHAAIVLGSAFNETAADVNVYWTYLNANGGLNGRKVNNTIEDDKYTAQGAQVAFQQCQGLNPMFIIGGIGFDQDPVVRDQSELNAELYFYTVADDGSKGSGGPHQYKYSFTGAPTIEDLGTWLGQVAIKNDPGPYGAVYVNDPNWVGGYNTFKSYMDSHGGSSVDGNSYTMGGGGDASQFPAYITELQLAGVKTVYLWMNALGADAFVKQAAQKGYYPAYVTPDGFDLVTGTVGESFDDQSPSVKPALGAWVTPAFDPNNHNVPWWPEEKVMLDAYAKYDGGHQPDDIDWQAWLGFKQLADTLKVCGQNCDRNDLAGMFLSGYATTDAPLCRTDFSHGTHNFGGTAMNLWKAHRVPYVSVDYPSASQHTVWQQITTCSNRFN